MTKPFCSFVIPFQGDLARLEETLAALAEAAKGKVSDMESVVVVDGRENLDEDGLRGILDRVADVQAIILAREYGTDKAIVAGLDAAIGDVAIAVGNDPAFAGFVGPMLDEASKGFEAVVGTFKGARRHGLAYGPARSAFWKAYGLMVGEDMSDPVDAFLVSRGALGHIMKHSSPESLLRILPVAAGAGHSKVRLPQSPPEEAGGQRPIGSSASRAMGMVLASTAAPMRLATLTALAAGGLNLLYMAYVVCVAAFGRDVAPGWTTTSLQMSGMFFLFSIVLAMMSEYILSLHSQASGHHGPRVDGEMRSKSIGRRGRLNVVVEEKGGEAL